MSFHVTRENRRIPTLHLSEAQASPFVDSLLLRDLYFNDRPLGHDYEDFPALRQAFWVDREWNYPFQFNDSFLDDVYEADSLRMAFRETETWVVAVPADPSMDFDPYQRVEPPIVYKSNFQAVCRTILASGESGYTEPPSFPALTFEELLSLWLLSCPRLGFEYYARQHTFLELLQTMMIADSEQGELMRFAKSLPAPSCSFFRIVPLSPHWRDHCLFLETSDGELMEWRAAFVREPFTLRLSQLWAAELHL